MKLIASGEKLTNVRIEITADEFLKIINEQLKNQSLMVMMEESDWQLPQMDDVKIVERIAPMEMGSGSSPEKPQETQFFVVSGQACQSLPYALLQILEHTDKFEPNITIVRREDADDFQQEM